MHFLKPGLVISCKNGKHMFADTFLLSFLRMPWSSHSCNDRRYSYFTRNICNRYCTDFICCLFQVIRELKISQRGRGRERLETVQFNYIVKSVQSALSDLLTTPATHGTFSLPSTKRGLILIGLELNTNARESFEHC